MKGCQSRLQSTVLSHIILKKIYTVYRNCISNFHKCIQKLAEILYLKTGCISYIENEYCNSLFKLQTLKLLRSHINVRNYKNTSNFQCHAPQHHMHLILYCTSKPHVIISYCFCRTFMSHNLFLFATLTTHIQLLATGYADSVVRIL